MLSSHRLWPASCRRVAAFMLRSRYEIPDAVEQFTERACQRGTLGRFPAQSVMLMLMANALKLEKFGA